MIDIFIRIRQQVATLVRVFLLIRNKQRNMELDGLIQMAVQPNSYLVTTGFLHSKNVNRPVGLDDSPVPWLNYPINDFLGRRLSEQHSLFEYGSGYSTIFFSRRVKHVTSVEYDSDWFREVVNLTEGLSNVNILFRQIGPEYVNAISESGDKYDIVLVDGRKRVECAISASDFLSEQGVVVLDDSERKKYLQVEEFYISNGYKCISFSGLKPAGFAESTTTIFYREGNCLGI